MRVSVEFGGFGVGVEFQSYQRRTLKQRPSFTAITLSQNLVDLIGGSVWPAFANANRNDRVEPSVA
jgi:hypothetical protein